MSVSDFFSALMAIVRVVEEEVTKKRDETRLMEVSLRADRAELEAKERERSILHREKDRMLAVYEAGEKLVSEFLEADDDNKNFDEKAMMDAIEALIGRGGSNGSDVAGFGRVYGGTINYLENTQNLGDEGTAMASVEGQGVIAYGNGGG